MRSEGLESREGDTGLLLRRTAGSQVPQIVIQNRCNAVRAPRTIAGRVSSTRRLCVLLLIQLAVMGQTAGSSPVFASAGGTHLKTRVEESLGLAGSNRDEIKEALARASPEKRAYLSFIIAFMPTADLAQVTAEYLMDNVEYACRARDRFPWGRKIPEDVFLHYVLPHRVTQEPLEDWRPYLFEGLSREVSGDISMEDAALAVNRWCGARVRFGYTQWRDQGPFETLKSGYGRCEEMTILLVCALRAVSIPARVASTPRWSVMDGNHAWAEVWIDGEWKYAGSCEPADRLNAAWFTEAVRRAAVVYSIPYGIPEDTTDFYKKGDGFAIVNSTGRYSIAGTLRITVTERGRPSRFEPVSVSVFNSGALRPVALLESDEEGKALLAIGAGEYFVAGGRDRCAWSVAKVEPGRASAVLLDLSSECQFNSKFWLRYGTGGPTR